MFDWFKKKEEPQAQPNNVTSTIVCDMPQIDGRRVVRERHVFVDGTTRTCDYMAEKDDDVQQKMVGHACDFYEQINAPTPVEE